MYFLTQFSLKKISKLPTKYALHHRILCVNHESAKPWVACYLALGEQTSGLYQCCPSKLHSAIPGTTDRQTEYNQIFDTEYHGQLV